jgi:hypothetical protein
MQLQEMPRPTNQPKGNTMTSKLSITPEHISNAAALIKSNPQRYLPTRPLPTTAGRRKQAIIAAGRDALATVLLDQFKIKNYGTLTKALRAGHNGDATDFDSINRQGAVALGLL